MKIVCLGDSFTKGLGVNQAECWVSLFDKKTNYQVINKGINGDTTNGMLARFYRDVVDEKPRFVLIDGGFNDFIAGADCGTVQANIMSMVHQAYHNNIIPVLLTIPSGNAEQFKVKWPDFIKIEKIIEKYMRYIEWLREFSEGFSVFYIDCFKATNNVMFKNNNYIDGIHMNEDGHRTVARIIFDFFNESVT